MLFQDFLALYHNADISEVEALEAVCTFRIKKPNLVQVIEFRDSGPDNTRTWKFYRKKQLSKESSKNLERK